MIPSALATNLSGLHVFSTVDAKHDGEGVTVERNALFVTYLATVLSFDDEPLPALRCDDHHVGSLAGRGAPDLLWQRLAAHRYLAPRWRDLKMDIAEAATP